MKKVLKKAINPIRIIITDSRFTGIMLILCTVISMFLANSNEFAEGYKNLWEKEWITATLPVHLPENFLSFINNFLMAFFFLMAGMEIKRELVNGELSSFKKAILPFASALGGMLVPALIFVAFNLHSSYINGWGIPTATDIAFSLGIASLLGKRVPVSLKILLMALAIIDDLGAIAVIAVFYGGHINGMFLAISGLVFAALLMCNYAKVKFGMLQIILWAALWFSIANSGIEASITGVLIAFATPINMLPKIEKAIHGYVNFLILPLFALANTAILLPTDIVGSFDSPLALGIIAGLVIGKPLGIFLFSRVLVALKIASLPRGVKWSQVFGMGILAGIGFTMSIFTTMLAFNSEEFRDIAKVAIIVSVVLSLALSIGYFIALNVKVSMDFSEDHEHERSHGHVGEPALRAH